MHNKFKKRLLIAVIIAFVAFIIWLCALMHSGDKMPSTNNIPDVSVAGDNGYSELPENEVMIDAVTGLSFLADVTEQDVNIQNREENSYCFVVAIYLGDGTLLYESPMVQPGDSLTSIRLSQTITEGIYQNSIMVYRFYSTDDFHTVVSQCEFPIEIRCVK